ncbi:hypothetical protein C8R45DRAFT_945443 [Mycena sanguinolenta]|nr:hypothetical protein C8R45DRAFT_945443 [Mycena sanguinolenta]
MASQPASQSFLGGAFDNPGCLKPKLPTQPPQYGHAPKSGIGPYHALTAYVLQPVFLFYSLSNPIVNIFANFYRFAIVQYKMQVAAGFPHWDAPRLVERPASAAQRMGYAPKAETEIKWKGFKDMETERLARRLILIV